MLPPLPVYGLFRFIAHTDFLKAVSVGLGSDIRRRDCFRSLLTDLACWSRWPNSWTCCPVFAPLFAGYSVIDAWEQP